MTEVKGLAKRMAEVSWACDKGNSPPLTGVHVDGDRLIATDKYRLATVECVVPVDQPVTVPLDAVAPILRMARDVQMSIYNGHLYLVPDDGTQIISICYEEKFPNWAAVARTDQECFLKLSAARLKEMLDRASVVIKNERFPKLIITLGNERLHMYLRSQEVEIEDELELDGQAIHPDIQIGMAPRNLSDALANSPNDQIEIWYFLNGSDKRPLRVAGGSGYTAWVMPRVDLPTPSGTSP
jgi:DNA polymerase III sliding clamp (beta) subunit (PCNA family)